MSDLNYRDGWDNPPSDIIKTLLERSKVIAVVGLSSKPERASNGVSSYLKTKGYKIIPVNPMEKEILGEKSYPDLESIPEKVDIVDVFRRPEEALSIVESAINIGAKAVWLQESVISPEAFKKGRESGLEMVMDRCILKMHRQLMG